MLVPLAVAKLFEPVLDDAGSEGWHVQWETVHRGKSQSPVAWVAAFPKDGTARLAWCLTKSLITPS